MKPKTENSAKHNGIIPSKLPNEVQTLGRQNPSFTLEETIVLCALVGGKSDKQVCIELRMPSSSFHRLLRDLCEKTGVASHLSLLVWALRRMKSRERRTGIRDGYPRPTWRAA